MIANFTAKGVQIGTPVSLAARARSPGDGHNISVLTVAHDQVHGVAIYQLFNLRSIRR